MNSPQGWVKLHRSVTENWIWSKEKHNYQSAWIDLVMMVNHEDRKIAIGNKIVIVHRGQTWTSYEKLKKRWKWSNNKMRGFINALVSDKMITANPTHSGVLLTVLNYSIYQGSSDPDDEQWVNQWVNTSVNQSVNTRVNTWVTNKNDIRMIKNEKKGDAPAGWEK